MDKCELCEHRVLMEDLFTQTVRPHCDITMTKIENIKSCPHNKTSMQIRFTKIRNKLRDNE